MENKPDVPNLDPNNYGPWSIALKAAAYTTDSINHLTSNPETPVYPAQLQDHNKRKHYLIGKIISAIPNETANLLIDPIGDPTAHDLIQNITNHLNTSNANDHRYLKLQDQETHLLPYTTLEHYVAQHEQIRAKMMAAKYHEISNPMTTVEFMIDGLEHNPSTTQIGLQLMAQAPTDIKDFTHKFKCIQSYQDATIQSTSIPNAPPPQRQTPRYYPSTPRGRRFFNRGHYTHKPCNFHQALGLQNPQHTDDQCRHPDHLKNKNQNYQKPTTRVVKKTYARAQTAHSSLYDADDEMLDPEAPYANNEDESTWILDSAAHPTHTNKRSIAMTDAPRNLRTKTATNHETKCTHSVPKTLRTNRNSRITLPVVVNLHITDNLVSVHDLAVKFGDVIFTT